MTTLTDWARATPRVWNSVAALLLATPFTLPAQKPASLAITGLKHEYRINPLGTDVAHPRLSWQLRSSERDVMQSAYQIQVATSPAAFNSGGKALLWDSGKIGSSGSLFQPYGGAPLQSRTRYHWRVRVWAGRGAASAWSAPAWWETGLLTPEDWTATWIGPNAASRDSSGAPAPMFRRGFEVRGQVASARVYITARGLYELHLNGRRVGEDYFAPGWTSYHNRLQYQSYDVTSMLVPGENAIGAILGDGWYRGYLGFSGRKNDYGTRVALLAQLELRYRDGRVERISTDGSWKSSTGPITFADIYRGESYDARLEQAGWDAARFDDRGWQPVALVESGSAALIAPVSEPVRRTQIIKPVSLFTAPNGQLLFDLGQNITGWVRLKVRGAPGTTITLRHAEVLDKAGNLYTDNLRAAYQTDRYTLKGGGEEVFEPHFTYHGFRYVALEGLIGDPSIEMVTGVVVHSDLQRTGAFETSDSTLNQLQRNIVWGQRGNFLDIPTDCPQRDERLGWTGDAQVFARTAAFNMNVSGFFAKWLADLAADQHPGGSVPWVIPNPLGGDSTRFAAAAGWADAATVVPWTMYLTYGDRGVLERQFGSMRQWVDYARGRAGPSLIWNRDDHFGDWLAWHSDDASYPGATTGKDFIATAYLAHSADLVARAAEVLGRTAEAAKYRELFAQIRAAFRREFVSPNGRVGENTQTAYAIALNFGLLDASEMESAAQRLVDDIRRHGGHLSTGFLGTPELTQALSQNGHLDAAFALLTQRGYPGWIYPITRGATTMWERWDGIRPDGSFQDISMNSFNHYAFGAIGDWMYRTVGGIDLDPAAPGYQHALIAPRIGAGLTSATTSLETGYGTLATAWTLRGGVMTLTVTVPANTAAQVTLQDVRLDQVRESNALLSHTTGLHSSIQRRADVVVEVGSGSYTFTAPRAP